MPLIWKATVNEYMKNKVGKGDTSVGNMVFGETFGVKSSAVRIMTSNMIRLLLMFVFAYLL